MRRFLGIDGGGTQTRAALVDASGRVYAVGTAGPSNYHNVSLPVATQNLRLAAEDAYRQAGLALAEADGAFLGLAGVKAQVDIVRMTAAAESIGLAPAGAITVVNDLHNALAGGLDGAPGIALIAGTGSNCLGRDRTGETFMCGGWGWLLDDRGAGFGIAAEALRVAVRAADGRGPATRLLPSALEFFRVREPNELLARLYGQAWSPGMVADFAPVAIRLAAEGDVAAVRILHEGAAALAELVTTTAGKLAFDDSPAVVLLGGCVRSGPPYQPLVEAAVRKACPRARLAEPRHSPVHGAALNALRAGGCVPLPPLSTPAATELP